MLLEQELVESVEPTRVKLKSGTVLKAHTLVWGAGLSASPLAKSLGSSSSAAAASPSNRISSIAGHPEAFAVGDIAWITDTKHDEVLPQLGSVALQAGAHAGETIVRALKGKDREPFRYHDKGTMATIGRGAAVVQLPRSRGAARARSHGSPGAPCTSRSSPPARTAPRPSSRWTWAGFTHDRAARISVES